MTRESYIQAVRNSTYIGVSRIALWRNRFRLAAVCMAVVALCGNPSSIWAQSQPIVQLDYLVNGQTFEVSPSALTIPKGIATEINANTRGDIEGRIVASLRGPSVQGTQEIVAATGESIQLPAFSQPGLHFLENIRLVIDENTVIPATPSTVTINVLDELLVGDVTTRQLTLEEIQELGIQFDDTSFQAFNFTIGLTTSSGVIQLDLPVLLPLAGNDGPMLVGSQIPGLDIQTLDGLPGLELPNLGLEPIMLEVIEGELPPGEVIPPIPGVLVIPGNIAFLNQFFSVLLNVSNQAPDGTPLVVTNVRAEIKLPGGPDGVVGDILGDPPFNPGDPEFDNPLRLAATADGRQNILPVFAPGNDGLSGTADDIDQLAPQRAGTAEFLVEGMREGGHVIDIEIRGTLLGLPSGPVEVMGQARGAVVVRDPTFSLTFIHPDTVRAGEFYDLVAHVQNTSLVDANLVTVSLDPPNLTGARLLNAADASQTIDTIPAGDSATLTFRLEAQRTGRVTASTLQISGEDADAVNGRRLSLSAGVTEQGAPISPDTLILPPSVGFLRDEAGNDDLTFRAIALLGEAHSVATAPRGSLPFAVEPITAGTVIQRARELSESGFRLELSYQPGAGGPPTLRPDGLLLTLQDLYYDFLGAGSPDSGWDSLYRDSRQARLFGSALAEVLGRQADALGFADLIELQRSWGDTESYRSNHLTIMTQAQGSQLPVTLEVGAGFGGSLGGSFDPQGGARDIAGADLIQFDADGPVEGQFAVLTQAFQSTYTATLTAQAAGSFDLGIVVPNNSGELTHIVFRNLTVTAGEQITAAIRPGSTPLIEPLQGGGIITPTAQTPILDTPPQILGIVQNADPDVDEFGRVFGILFDEDVDPDSAREAIYTVGDAIIPTIPAPALVDGNLTRNAVPQIGDRIVLVGLRDPIGPFVPRTLDVSNVEDLRGQVMQPVIAQPIVIDPDIGPGGQLTGRVLRSDGSPVPDPEIVYTQPVETSLGCRDRLVSVKPGDADGRYGIDFVLKDSCRREPFIITAVDPATGESGTLRSGVRADGDRVMLDIVLVGRGGVEGTVRDENGDPLPGVSVTVTSGTDMSRRRTGTDQNGFYVVNDVPVGEVAIEARGPTGVARASRLLAEAGSIISADLTIVDQQVLGSLAGELRFPDGTIAAGVEVFLSIAGSGGFIAVTMTDENGTYRFDDLPPGNYTVTGLDVAGGLIGEANIEVTEDSTSDNPAFALVVFGGTGSVSGTILEQTPGGLVPVPGALVAGGTQIVTADQNGAYFIPVVPVGQRRIEAVNPVNGATGATTVTILAAGQASTGIDVIVDPLGTISGRALSPQGQPVPGQDVRLIVERGTSLFGTPVFFVRTAETAADGTYSFEQVEFGTYPLTAVRGTEVANATATLSALTPQVIVDLNLVAPTGSVAGGVVDDTGLDVAAQVTVKALTPNPAGQLEFGQVGTVTSDPDTGFTFTNLFPGPFSVTASSFFSPGTASASGTLPANDPNIDGIELVLASNTSTLSGCVLNPDGTIIDPVLDATGTPLPLSVFITSRALRSELSEDPQNTEPDGIRVDASGGCYTSSIPLPPDAYRIEVTDDRAGSPTLGLTGRASTSLQRGQDGVLDVRLLGLGSLAVEIVDASGDPIPGVELRVNRTSYPNDVREALVTTTTDVTPFVFDDITEGPVSVSAVVSNDPGVDVGGREELRGFGGNISGVVVRDAAQTVRVTIAAAGGVTGRFLQVDGVTPIPNAQIELSSGSGTAFDVSDATGTFEFNGIARGGFRLDAFDAGSGRMGRATGTLDFDGQRVTRDIELGPLGTVRGVVLDASRIEPAAGANVRLVISGLGGGTREVTTDVDGSFLFEGVPGGDLSLTAVDDDGLSGRATGTLDTEGQVVDLEITLEGSGRVEGTVFDAFNVPAAAADVSITDSMGQTRVTQTGIAAPDLGRFAFDVVPFGDFSITARPAGALTPGDGGRALGTVSFDRENVVADVTFGGLITVGVEVSGGTGATPIDVRLDSTGPFGGRLAPTTVQGSVFVFEGVPRTPLTVSAMQTTLAGAELSASATLSAEDLPAAGERLAPDIQLMLADVADVPVTVLDAGGLPVSGALVSITAGPVSSMALTGADGSANFVGIPFDVALRLDADAQGGAAVFIGNVDATGVIRDAAGTAVDPVVLTLDAEAPTVIQTTPANGSVGVLSDSVLQVVFSETIDATSLTSCTPGSPAGPPSILLLESGGTPPAINDPGNPCDDSNVVPVTLNVSPDGTTVTLTPQRALQGLTQHVLVISDGEIGPGGTAVGGVRDLVGIRLSADVTTSFVTTDDVSPTMLTVSPEDGSVNVPLDSLIRITFSEALAAASVDDTTVTLQGPTGPVGGQRDLILGNTVVVLTPDAPLLPNAAYSLTIAGVSDVAGNVQAAQDNVTIQFATPDSIAPTIDALLVPGGARPGETVEVTATTSDTDVASVEFFVDGVLSATDTVAAPPGTYQATIVMPANPIDITARAIDTSGNVGAVTAAATIPVIPDNGPNITITAPGPGSEVVPGATVRFEVQATDDVAVASITGAASGVVSQSETRPVAPAPVANIFFDVTLPAGAPNGTLTFAAVARDSAGQTSATATVTLNVVGDAPPTVTLANVIDGEQVIAGSIRQLQATANDDVAVTQVEFFVDNVLAGVDTAAPYTVNYTWLACPGGAAVEVRAVATDSTGQTAQDTLTVNCIEDMLPTVALANVVDGETVIEGTVRQLQATATDDVAVTQVEFVVDGLSVAIDATAPYNTNYTWLACPGGTAIDVTAIATDTSGQTVQDTLTVNCIEDNPPTVTLANVTDGEQVNENTARQIQAVVDDDVAVTQVEFFVDNVSVGIDTNTPYNVNTTWPACPGGAEFDVRATATDSAGQTTDDTLTVICIATDGTNLLQNGSFEISAVDPGVSLTINAPSNAINDWSVLNGSIDHVGTFWVHSDGGRSIDLNGLGSGSMGQSITTEIGAQYELRFDLAGNFAGPPVIKTLQVDVGDASQTFQFDTNGRTVDDLGWVEEALTFFATGPSTLLQFTSADAGAFGAAVDNARIIQLVGGGVDLDGDGLTNAQEVGIGTDPTNPDSDGDGRTDGQELLSDGTDPLDSTDTGLIRALTAGGALSDQAVPATDAAGNIHVAWVDLRDDPSGEIFYQMLAPDGTVLIGITRLTTDAATSLRPAIAVTGTGTVEIVWQDRRLGAPEIFHTRLDPLLHPLDGTPATDAQITLIDDRLISAAGAAESNHPRVAIDAFDRLNVVWENPGLGEIRFAQIAADGSVAVADQPIVIGNAGQLGARPEIAVDAANDVHVVASMVIGTCVPEITYTMLDGDTAAALIAPTLLTADDCIASTQPSVTFAPDGIASIVSENSSGGGAEVFLQRIDPSLDDQNGDAANAPVITVLAEIQISDSVDTSNSLPTATADGDGNLHVTSYIDRIAGLPADLVFQVVDTDATPLVAEFSLPGDALAVSAISDETSAFAVVDGVTTHVTWTNDTTGVPQVVLLTISPDNDRDGLSNAEERLLGTDKNNADTDGDGIPDGIDANPTIGTSTWINPAGGSWNDPANWENGELPGPNTDVVIDVPGDVTITHDAGDTVVNGITSANPFVLSGGTLQVATTIQVDNTFTMSGGTLRDATVLPGAGGQGLVFVGISNLDAVTIAGSATISDQVGVTVVNGLTVNGAIVMEDTATAASTNLLFLGGQLLGGTGEIVFNGSFSLNRILVENGTLTIGPDLTIRNGTGSGTIETFGAQPGNLINQGLVQSQDSQQIRIDFNGWVNQGTLRAISTGQLLLDGTIGTLGAFEAAGGVVRLVGDIDLTGQTLALDATTGSLSLGGTVTGGTLASSDGAAFVAAAPSPTYDGVTIDGTLRIPDTAIVTIENGVTVNGEISIEDMGIFPSTGLSFTGDQVLGGTGEVVFNGNFSRNVIVVTDGTLTIGPGMTVRSGTGTAGLISTAAGRTGNLINQGVIQAQDSRPITIDFDGWVNQGTLRAISAGQLLLDGTIGTLGAFEAAGGVVRLVGDIDLTGQTLALDATTGSLSLGGTVTGGTLASSDGAAFVAAAPSPTYDGVTIDGTLRIPDTAIVTIENGVTVNGEISIEDMGIFPSTGLSFTGDQVLGGTGEVVFNGNFSRNVIVVTDGTLTIGPGMTVRSGTGTAGLISTAAGRTGNLINQGVIQAQDSRPITIDFDGWSNQGTLSATAGSLLSTPSDFSMAPGSTISLDVRGTGSPNIGRLVSTATPTLTGGVLNVNFVDGFVPALGQTLVPVTYANAVGEFANVNNIGIGAFLALDADYGATALTLTVVPSGTNGIVNPGFENGATGWTFAGGGSGTCAAPCTFPNTGVNAGFKNLFDGGAGTISQTITTVPGNQYPGCSLAGGQQFRNRNGDGEFWCDGWRLCNPAQRRALPIRDTSFLRWLAA